MLVIKQKPKFCHTERSEVSKNGKFSFNLCGFFANAQNDKGFVILSESEVSIKSRCVINSMDISPTAQYDNIEVFATLCKWLVSQ